VYVDFYGLDREPFHITPDPDFLYLSPCHKEAFATILYGVEQQKGFVVVSGEVGTGKTTILRAYLKQLKKTKIRPIYIFDPDVSFEELLEAILHEFDYGEPATSQFTRLQWLRHKLIDEYEVGSTVVLMIDEAQNMPVETLEKLRVLTNLETPTDKLIQVLLVGQPELEEKLALHQLRQLNQRVAVRAKLRPLSKRESQGYIRFRLVEAGGKPEQIFTEGAVALITRYAKGNPRVLNIVCDNALISGYGGQKRPITAGIVRDVIKELDASPLRWQMQRLRWVAAAVAVVGLFGFATWYGMQLERADRDAGVAMARGTDSDEGTLPTRVDEEAILRERMEARYNASEVREREERAGLAPQPAVIPAPEEVPEPLPAAPPQAPTAEAPVAPSATEADPALEEAVTSLPEPAPVAPPETTPAEVDIPEPDETPRTAADETAALTSELEALRSPAVADVDSAPEAEKTEPEVSNSTVVAARQTPVTPPVEAAEKVVEEAPKEATAPLTKVAEVEEVVEEKDQETPQETPRAPAPTPAEQKMASTRETEKLTPGKVEVTPGDNLSQLITKVYGFCNPQLIAAVRARNPQIIKPDMIYYGDALVFPPLEELLLSVPEHTTAETE
jgi:general secretion pathway protein A